MPVTIDLGVLSRFSADIEAELADPSASGPVRDAIFAWGEFYRSWAKLRFSKQSRGGGEWPPLSPSTIRARTDVRKALGSERSAVRSAKKRNRLAALRVQRAEKAHAKRPSAVNELRIKAAKLKQRETAKKVHARVENADTRANKAAGSVRILYDTGTLIGALDPKLNVGSGGVQENIPFGITVGYGGSSKHEKFPATIAGLAAIHQAGNEKLPARPIIVTPPDDANCIRQMSRALADAITKKWRQYAG